MALGPTRGRFAIGVSRVILSAFLSCYGLTGSYSGPEVRFWEVAELGGDEQLGSNSMAGLSKLTAGCGYFRIAMNSGLATLQIADGLEALSIEQ